MSRLNRITVPMEWLPTYGEEATFPSHIGIRVIGWNAKSNDWFIGHYNPFFAEWTNESHEVVTPPTHWARATEMSSLYNDWEQSKGG